MTLVRTVPLSRHTALSTGLWVSMFAALTWAGAQIQIPVQPVPMTLQTPFVLLAGVLLGARHGAWSQLAYLGLGILGLPVFASHHWGVGPLYFVTSPTAGYLLAFPLAAWLCGRIVHDAGAQRRLGALGVSLAGVVAGLALVFALGVAKLALHVGPGAALADGFAKLQLWDAIKVAGTAILAAGFVAPIRYPRAE